MTEARKSDRLTTSLSARIVCGDDQVIDCLIRDLSDTGAKLEVGGAFVVPQEFGLEITTAGQDFRIRAEVKWRYSHMVGVKFAGSATARHDDMIRDALIAENARLWAVLESFAKRLTQLGEPVALPDDLLVGPLSLGANGARQSAVA